MVISLGHIPLSTLDPLVFFAMENHEQKIKMDFQRLTLYPLFNPQVLRGDVELLSLLLKYGADPDRRSSQGASWDHFCGDMICCKHVLFVYYLSRITLLWFCTHYLSRIALLWFCTHYCVKLVIHFFVCVILCAL